MLAVLLGCACVLIRRRSARHCPWWPLVEVLAVAAGAAATAAAATAAAILAAIVVEIVVAVIVVA